jgi:hypothetical protein
MNILIAINTLIVNNLIQNECNNYKCVCSKGYKVDDYTLICDMSSRIISAILFIHSIVMIIKSVLPTIVNACLTINGIRWMESAYILIALIIAKFIIKIEFVRTINVFVLQILQNDSCVPYL